MKNSLLSTVTIVALSSLSFAGGDVAPIEEPIVAVGEPQTISDSGFYLGVGVGSMGLHNDLSDEKFSTTAVTLQAGYQYNPYIALEGRYTKDISGVEYTSGNTRNGDISDYPADFSNIAIYLKPMYPIGAMSIYALLGYGEVTLTNVPLNSSGADRGEAGFQWGVGASYQMTNSIDIFVDYTSMYDDKGFNYRAMNSDIKADLITVGLSYRF